MAERQKTFHAAMSTCLFLPYFVNVKQKGVFSFLIWSFVGSIADEVTTTTNIDTRFKMLQCCHVQFPFVRSFLSLYFITISLVCTCNSVCVHVSRVERKIYLLRTVAYGRAVGSQRKKEIGKSKGKKDSGNGSDKTR